MKQKVTALVWSDGRMFAVHDDVVDDDFMLSECCPYTDYENAIPIELEIHFPDPDDGMISIQQKHASPCDNDSANKSNLLMSKIQGHKTGVVDDSIKKIVLLKLKAA